MIDVIRFTVVGLVVGCIYALTATGLVVTYTTSGIFNFAHGAIGMICAFAFWDLHVHHHWPTLLALVAVLAVLAPVLGAAIEKFLMRNLHGAGTSTALMVTLGLLLLLVGVATIIWDPTDPRVVPEFFKGHSVRIASIVVTWHQLIVVITAAAVAVGLRLFFYRTRTGVAMRAVVDDPDLAAMAGARPYRIAQLSWAMGAVLAGLAGILLAPLISLDILVLTLLVINGYAAAIVGRLKSLPLTFAGGLALGLVEAQAVGWLPGDILNKVRFAIPVVFLFVALVLVPEARLRAGRLSSGYVPKVPSLRTSVIASGVFVVAAVVVSGLMSQGNLITAGNGMVMAIVMLSLVLLTGYGGQVSLCQLTFTGIGAFAMGKVGGGDSILGLVAAVVLAGAVGALVALPAIRLRGLYLALATLAFAQGMLVIFFQQDWAFGYGSALRVGRVHLPGLRFETQRSYFVLLSVVFALAAIGVLALRRGSFGRRLAAMSDSPAACATLGLNLTALRMMVFTISAALAGLAGALFGGLRGTVGSFDFQMFTSLVLLLLLTVWGVQNVTAALIAGISLPLFTILQNHVPELRNLTYVFAGLGALGLGRNPSGVIGDIASRLQRGGGERTTVRLGELPEGEGSVTTREAELV